MATAVVTWAIERTWSVRFDAMRFTFSVRPRHVPRHALDLGLAAELALGADLARDARDLGGERAQLVDHRVDRVLAARAISPRASTVIFCDRSPLATAVVTWAMLRTWSVRFDAMQVDVLGQVAPRAGDALDLGLAAELALGADLARDARDLVGERRQLVDHRVDGVLQLEDLALRVDRDLLRQVAVGHRRRDLGDVAHLARSGSPAMKLTFSVRSRHVPADALDLGLAAERALRAHLARDAGDLVGERRELVDHRVDRVA